MAPTIKITFFKLLNIALIIDCIPYCRIHYINDSTIELLDDMYTEPQFPMSKIIKRGQLKLLAILFFSF